MATSRDLNLAVETCPVPLCKLPGHTVSSACKATTMRGARQDRTFDRRRLAAAERPYLGDKSRGSHCGHQQ
jgi:hypothetical protein